LHPELKRLPEERCLRQPILQWKKSDYGLANSDLPKSSETFKKSMPDGICRIGVRQPIGRLTVFAEAEFGNPSYHYRLHFGNEKSVRGGLTRTSTFRKNDVLVVPLATVSFRYRLLFSNEIKRERWVDEDVTIALLYHLRPLIDLSSKTLNPRF